MTPYAATALLTFVENIVEHSHPPNTIHILLIILAPLVTTQRRPWQCGVAVIKGDIKNPNNVSGTHNFTYKWDAL